jgi:hypothetical protein
VHRRAAEGRDAGQALILNDSFRRGAAVAVGAVTGGVVALTGAFAQSAPAVSPLLQPVDAAAQLAAGVTDRDPRAPDPAVTPAPVLGAVSPTATGPRAAEPEVVDAAALAADALRAGGATPGRDASEEGRDEDDSATEDEDTSEAADRADRSSSGSGADCGVDTSGLGRVKSHVREAAQFLGCRFDEPTMLGIAGRGGPSDHPNGLALDFMVDRATGDALAACVLENKEALGVTYVIWRQRMNDGGGWERMEDRGGATANHFDHVHVSFAKKGGGATPRC